MTECEGRVIEAPKIDYQCNTVKPKDGTWKQNDKFYQSAVVRRWALLSFVRPDKEKQLKEFCSNLSNVCNGCGIQLPERPDQVRYIQSHHEVEWNIKSILDSMYEDCSIIVVILDEKDIYKYVAVKSVAEITFGCITQCILWRNVCSFKESLIHNLVQKINAKLNGINWKLQADECLKKYICNTPTLIIGIDCYHPGRDTKDSNGPSIAAIVGNLDTKPFQFWAKVQVQENEKDEIVQNLKEAIIEMLVMFYKSTKEKPTKIIIYRDGVPDGQFFTVLNNELKSIQNACMEMDRNKSYRPELCYIVCQKRHHVRLFPKYPMDEMGKGKNVPPGTVCDLTIVHPSGFDFYLCSHYGIQGTSRPTHYHVLYNEINLNSNKFNQLHIHYVISTQDVPVQYLFLPQSIMQI